MQDGEKELQEVSSLTKHERKSQQVSSKLMLMENLITYIHQNAQKNFVKHALVSH